MTHIQNVREFGALIRRERKKQLLNQRELAGLSNVGSRFLGELEQGKPTIEIEKALKVAQMLGIVFSASLREEGGDNMQGEAHE